MTEKELMLAGELYVASDAELVEMRLRKFRFMDAFNGTGYEDFAERERLARELFAHVGKNVMINKPFHCDYGSNISIGDNFFANYGCVILDVNKVSIGNNVFMAPCVCLYTAGHPIDKDIRNENLEYGWPITIGDDVRKRRDQSRRNDRQQRRHRLGLGRNEGYSGRSGCLRQSLSGET